MATADGMYERLSIAYRNLFAAGSQPSLALAHGARALHAGFVTFVLDVGANEPLYGIDDADATASASWRCLDRR